MKYLLFILIMMFSLVLIPSVFASHELININFSSYPSETAVTDDNFTFSGDDFTHSGTGEIGNTAGTSGYFGFTQFNLSVNDNVSIYVNITIAKGGTDQRRAFFALNETFNNISNDISFFIERLDGQSSTQPSLANQPETNTLVFGGYGMWFTMNMTINRTSRQVCITVNGSVEFGCIDYFTTGINAEDEPSYLIFGSAPNNVNSLEIDISEIIIVNLQHSVPDTNPPAITLINLTSEGGLGQIIFNISSPTNNKQLGDAKTNDTTPTFTIFTNESSNCAIINNNSNLNYTDITRGSVECSITGGTEHICTLPNANQTGVDFHNFSVGCRDVDGNENLTSTSDKFLVNITGVPNTFNLFLDGIGSNRKYEFRTKANISANCSVSPDTCQVEISIFAPGGGVNISSGFNRTHIIYNITTLRIGNFSHGPTAHTLADSGTVNFTSDNRTKMVQVQLNLSNTGTTTNINLTYYNDNLSITKNFKGDLKTIYLFDDEFIESDISKKAVNLTYITAGSNFIFSDLTDILNSINISFDLTGFDLDANNEFSYTEHFNGTKESKLFNDTLSFHVDAPLGIFDDFVVNVSGRWDFTECDSIPTHRYGSDSIGNFLNLGIAAGGGQSNVCEEIYTDTVADFRNTSIIEIITRPLISASRSQNADCSAGSTWTFQATDGTNSVSLDSISVTKSNNPGGTETHDNVYNYTLTKVSSDYKTWKVERNGTNLGNKDLTSLNFNEQIKFKQKINAGADTATFGSCSATADFFLYQVKWGGAWLNRSVSNGTYKQNGNFTSIVLNITETNISKATLTWTANEPDNTNIKGYLSNTYNSSNPTFEEVTNGIQHTFVTVGNRIGVRFQLNSSSNITSPVVRKYTLDIVKSSIENVTVEINGINEFTFDGVVNSTTGVLLVNLSPTNNILNTIKISVESSGLLQVDNFKLNSSMNPISLNETFFETCTNCQINLTFSGDDLTVEDLKVDFLGSKNYTIRANDGTNFREFIMQIFYSDFNLSLPGTLEFYDVFPSFLNESNVTPEGQTQFVPIWNLTNQAYDQRIDIYAQTNESLNVCLNATFSNNSFVNVNITNENFTWINGTPIFLDNTNLVNGSEVVFNLTSGAIISRGFYLMDYLAGTITLNSSVATNTTRTNQSINIDMFLDETNSTILEFVPLNSESVRNASAPFLLLNTNVDYSIDYANGNFTLLNLTFNDTNLFVTYNHTVFSSFGDRQRFQINYTFDIYDYRLGNDFTFRLNTSYQKIIANISLNTDNYLGVWNWWDLNECSNEVFIPFVDFAAICVDCFFEETQLDNFNIITG